MFTASLEIAVVISVIHQIWAYNFNTLHPIIYEDAHKGMGINVRRSLFGYTTALHAGKVPRIFIGAPKGLDLGVPAKNPGVAFQCGIKQTCEMLQFDDSINATSIGKDDAWIGGTMDISSEADVIVICGFRWRKSVYFVNMIGICYISKVDERLRFKALYPIIDPSKATLVSSRITVYYYSLGEAGFSAHFTSDKQNPELLLGAPGLLNWFGGSVLYTNLNSASATSQKVSRQEINKFGLFGYAVSSGRYTSEGTLYASSSPKGSNYLGAVIVYRFGDNTDSYIRRKYILSGSQVGESFGTALISGDLNSDGYDDLVVGAPYYFDASYNDGRVHVYYGGKDRKDFADQDRVVHITGAGDGGQFGAALQYLGDINLDGYGDVAVGEPFGDGNRGRVYIYHGGPHGLRTAPAQILEARYIDNHLRGFGISISKAVDIDGNGYPDIAVGSYLSGHAVLLRSNPLIDIESQLNIVNDTKIQIGSTTIMHCYTHSGNPYIPSNILIRRKLTIDPNYQRVTLSSSTQVEKEIELKNKCELFVLTTKEKLYYLTEPVKISVSYELVNEPPRQNIYYVGFNHTDTFCKTCPVLLNVRPLEKDFSFALGCGEDDVCISNLNFDARFFELENNTFIIGSADVIRMEVLISNSGDSAYLTQIAITLPKDIRFNSIPKKCTEEEQGTLLCLVGNPLNIQAYVSVYLNMRDVRTNGGSHLNITVNVTTTSENKNSQNEKHFIIQLKDVVDLKLIGKAEPTWQFYTANSTFKQVFEIQKLGHSPAEQVSLVINFPTHIVRDNISHSIIKFYSILGSLRGQEILCKTDAFIEYIKEVDMEMNAIDAATSQRRRRQINSDFIYSNNLNNSITTDTATLADGEEGGELGGQILLGKTVTLDCRDSISSVLCTKFICDVGTIKSDQDIGVVRIKALIDTNLVKQFFEVENTIVLNSFGHVYAEFETDAESNNEVDITNTFLSTEGFHIDFWILLIATLVGLLLLIIITFILYKCGYFKRSKKLQLEKEKKLAAVEEFQNARLSGEPDTTDLDLNACAAGAMEHMDIDNK